MVWFWILVLILTAVCCFYYIIYSEKQRKSEFLKEWEEEKRKAKEYSALKTALKDHPLFLILLKEVIARIDSLCAKAKNQKIGQGEEDHYTLHYDMDHSRNRAYVGICKHGSPDFKIFLSEHGYDNLTTEQGRAMIENLYSALKTHYADQQGVWIGEQDIDITGVHPRLEQI